MKESIIKTSKSCYFCGRETGLELHHALHGTANRRLADQDGLYVYLCHEHHRMLHDTAEGKEMDKALEQAAEFAWIKTYCPPDMDTEEKIEKFIQRYGRNYL